MTNQKIIVIWQGQIQIYTLCICSEVIAHAKPLCNASPIFYTSSNIVAYTLEYMMLSTTSLSSSPSFRVATWLHKSDIQMSFFVIHFNHAIFCR